MSIENSTARPRSYRRWAALGFTVTLTAATLYFVFRGIDREVFARLLAAQNRALILAAVVFTFLQICLGAERWRAILSAISTGQAPSWLSVQLVFYASVFFNTLPVGTVGGDVARVLLARQFPLSVRQIVVSVLLDRIVTVCALVVLAVMTLPGVSHPLASSAWYGGLAVLVCAAAGFLLLEPAERLLGKWRDGRLGSILLITTGEVRHFARRGGLPALAWALASAFCGALAAYMIARSLQIDIGLVAMIAVMSIVTFISALPISFAGWGVREVSVVALLGLLGVDREAALLLSVEVGILGMFMNLPGGAIWLMMRRQNCTAVPLDEITRPPAVRQEI